MPLAKLNLPGRFPRSYAASPAWAAPRASRRLARPVTSVGYGLNRSSMSSAAAHMPRTAVVGSIKALAAGMAAGVSELTYGMREPDRPDYLP